MERLLEIKDLTVSYNTNFGKVTALDAVSLPINKDEFVAVVGESGCGKSTLGLSIIGLLPRGVARVEKGSIDYKGTNLVALDQDKMESYRGTEIAMIFQEPLTSLNPVVRVGNQIAEAITIRQQRENGEKKGTIDSTGQKPYKVDDIPASFHPRFKIKIQPEVSDEIVKWLNMVRIADPEQVMERYPFELSGGMRQRVMIAMALCQSPSLLVADEPTTALDVTTQAQVLKIMRELKEKTGVSILLVTHDLAVASQTADRVVVMYASEIVEDSNVYDLFSEPLHPYTKGLLSCVPTGTKKNSSLDAIPGSLPDLRQMPDGCRFALRCPSVMDICHNTRPRLLDAKKNHKVSCFLYGK